MGISTNQNNLSKIILKDLMKAVCMKRIGIADTAVVNIQ